VSAYAVARRDDHALTEDRGLKWYRSTQDVTSSGHRGFCQECGASPFWDSRGSDSVSVAAGTAEPTAEP